MVLFFCVLRCAGRTHGICRWRCAPPVVLNRVDSWRHAAILVDQAGWHLSGKLRIPSNITLIPLPAKCPELNPQENIWQFTRDNWLSNRLFKSYDDIVDRCCDAWNKLIDQPWKIMSIATRDWAYRS